MCWKIRQVFRYILIQHNNTIFDIFIFTSLRNKWGKYRLLYKYNVWRVIYRKMKLSWTPFERPPWREATPSREVTRHVNLNIYVLISSPDGRPPLLKCRISATKWVATVYLKTYLLSIVFDESAQFIYNVSLILESSNCSYFILIYCVR